MMFGIFKVFRNPCFVTGTLENVKKTIFNIVVDTGIITNKLTVMSLSTRAIGGCHQRGYDSYVTQY